MRKLGRQHGYYFSDNAEETFLVDWVLETILDFDGTKSYQRWMAEESDWDEEKDEIAVEHLGKLFEQIGAKLDERERKFFAGDRLTIADFLILSIYSRFTDETN